MGMHDGHRQRLRESFLATGFEGKTEHQVLELLLTYAIPRIDVNPVAHALMDRFGSLAAVLDADPEELMKIDHISENGVVLLKMMPALMKIYHENKWAEKPVLNNTPAVANYMIPRLSGERNEVLYLVVLDAHCHLNAVVKLSEGTPDQTGAQMRTMVSEVLRTDGKQLVLVHNHPSGDPSPSAADIILTRHAYETMRSIDVKLVDHIIISGDKFFSLLSHGMLTPAESEQ